jgi:hypothetical protein
MAEHTPTPWEYIDGEIRPASQGDRLLLVGIRTPMTAGSWMEEGRANAAFIVRAANAHTDLVGALQVMMEWAREVSDQSLDSEPSMRQNYREDCAFAREALSKAGS